jgi:hypothetical protein
VVDALSPIPKSHVITTAAGFIGEYGRRLTVTYGPGILTDAMVNHFGKFVGGVILAPAIIPTALPVLQALTAASTAYTAIVVGNGIYRIYQNSGQAAEEKEKAEASKQEAEVKDESKIEIKVEPKEEEVKVAPKEEPKDEPKIEIKVEPKDEPKAAPKVEVKLTEEEITANKKEIAEAGFDLDNGKVEGKVEDKAEGGILNIPANASYTEGFKALYNAYRIRW